MYYPCITLPASSSNTASSSSNKRQVRGGRKSIIGSSHSFLAAAFILTLSTINPSASVSASIIISGAQSASSTGRIKAVKSTHRNLDGAILSSASLWGHDDKDEEYKIVIAPSSTDAVIGSRVLQEVEEEDDHDHEGEDHDHDEVTEAAAVAEEDHDHEEEDHDHEEEDDHAATEKTDGHDDHDDHDDHEDDHDDHEDEHKHAGEEHDDHDDHETHDDHSGHAHAAHEHEDEFTATAANESKASSEPWGAVIGATLLVNLATFSGVLILVLPAMYRGVLKLQNRPVDSSPAARGHGKLYDIVIPGFAVGALVATAVFLVLPESVIYLSGEGHASHDDHSGEEDGHDDHEGHGHRHLEEEDSHAGEGSAAAKFGCSVLGGFLLPFVFAILFHHSDPMEEEGEKQGSVAIVNDEDDCGSCVSNDKQPGDDVEVGIAVAAEDSSSPLEETSRSQADTTNDTPNESRPVVNKQLCASILLGDSFHNFADGFFIAAAFRSCSVAVAISIMLVTLFHEIAQELADFIVLTKFGGLTVGKALAFNFLSGLTVCLGGIVFLATNPSDTATGVILAMAGGVYINIAACETAPRMEAAMKGRDGRVLMLFSIILGTIPLGLILLDHKHCG